MVAIWRVGEGASTRRLLFHSRHAGKCAGSCTATRRAAMFTFGTSGSALDTIAHIIQVALTPVFLLSGIATLLNVFSTRLARVADRVDKVGEELDTADAERAEFL